LRSVRDRKIRVAPLRWPTYATHVNNALTPAASEADRDLARVASAIAYLTAHSEEQPQLPDVAAAVGLSSTHFQRVFQRHAGFSPKRFLQHVTVRAAQGLLAESASVLDATYGAGLSGPGRLHDHFVTLEAMTPGEFRRRGAGLVIRHGNAPSPLGICRVAWTERGVCHVALGDDDDVRERYPDARFVADDAVPIVARVFGGRAPDDSLRLFVRGTNFQVQVWRALLRVPAGAVLSYSDLAVRVGRPDAARAVAGAVARNPIAVLIPCHRVLRASGALGGYRWGTDRKRALLALERGRRLGE
jgi:AraC family transcriptional regulator of adaptative response/methylated-DNA-[protein]-cysteine methyltransferase